jgi:hypothetical protein
VDSSQRTAHSGTSQILLYRDGYGQMQRATDLAMSHHLTVFSLYGDQFPRSPSGLLPLIDSFLCIVSASTLQTSRPHSTDPLPFPFFFPYPSPASPEKLCDTNICLFAASSDQSRRCGTPRRSVSAATVATVRGLRPLPQFGWVDAAIFSPGP